MRGLRYSVLAAAGLGVVILAAALLPRDGVVLVSTAGGLAGLAALALLKSARRVREKLRSVGAIARLRATLAADDVPHVTTNGDGRTLWLNAAARSLADFPSGPVLADVIGLFAVSPQALTDELFRRSEGEGSALRDLDSGDASVRLRLRRMAPNLLLWRVETLGPAHAGGEDDGVGLAVAGHGSNKGKADRNPITGDASPANTRAFEDALPVAMLKILPDGQIRDANKEARRLLRTDDGPLPPIYELAEGMGRPITEWLADAAEGHGLMKPEVVRSSAAGQDLFLQITLGRISDGPEPLLIAVLHDATELKSLEAQFVQSQKMQAIGQLAGGVAHDFNNLLTAISGHCDLLLLRHDEGDPDYGDLMQIAQNANRAAGLVGQLLAFSRKQTLRPQAIDIRDTLSDLTHLLNRLVGEKVTLDLNIAQCGKVIRADRRQFEQVIMNLVVNARDAMPDGGRIGLAVTEERVEAPLKRDRASVPPGDYVVIRVSDSGVGIHHDALPKIFEPFYTTKKTGEGTGLGLSTAYGIVKQTGGFVFAESAPDQGTTFTLYFPARDRPAAAPSIPKKPVSARRSPKEDGVVLLVEDEAPVRAFASRALRMRGYTVIEAEHGEDALNKLSDDELRVDLFVTDVIMPGLDGPSWVRKALDTRPDTRVVFMSGYTEEGLAENQSRIPHSVFLPKPFSLAELTSVVHRQLA
ncbi:MAG: ATP-binding protein [Paracoccaceae bacterium]|nr:ATP-binding protein [Paracoccaceae bacterium]